MLKHSLAGMRRRGAPAVQGCHLCSPTDYSIRVKGIRANEADSGAGLGALFIALRLVSDAQNISKIYCCGFVAIVARFPSG